MPTQGRSGTFVKALLELAMTTPISKPPLILGWQEKDSCRAQRTRKAPRPCLAPPSAPPPAGASPAPPGGRGGPEAAGGGPRASGEDAGGEGALPCVDSHPCEGKVGRGDLLLDAASLNNERPGHGGAALAASVPIP